MVLEKHVSVILCIDICAESLHFVKISVLDGYGGIYFVQDHSICHMLCVFSSLKFESRRCKEFFPCFSKAVKQMHGPFF